MIIPALDIVATLMLIGVLYLTHARLEKFVGNIHRIINFVNARDEEHQKILDKALREIAREKAAMQKRYYGEIGRISAKADLAKKLSEEALNRACAASRPVEVKTIPIEIPNANDVITDEFVTNMAKEMSNVASADMEFGGFNGFDNDAAMYSEDN